ncbi:MAG: RNA-binding protein [Gammaproteobacteria bacterium]|nr:RNA-binding protein [Gammaproteobacteria bacterium]MYL14413.1 RNA-binding protein [Gammaproteobacteria bacterium]
MPTGPKGEKRPADTIANAVHVMKVATGEAEESYVNAGNREGGKKGGATRAKRLSAKQRSEIARKAAAARWASA